MPHVRRRVSFSSPQYRQSGTPGGLQDGDNTRHFEGRQPHARRSVSLMRKLRNNDDAPKETRKFQVFLSAVDDRIDNGPHATYSGPPLVFDIDSARPDLSSLDLAARMTLMFADEVYFSPLTFYGQQKEWNHESLRESALTYLRTRDVQYRCDVLAWTGWFQVSGKREAADFLALLQALYEGSGECELSENDIKEWDCFSRRKGVLRVDLTARFVNGPRMIQ